MTTGATAYTGKVVCVTGGAGFIGSHLVTALAEQSPERLVVFDNLWLGNEANLDEAREFCDVELAVLDASNRDDIEKTLQGDHVDVAFQLATVPLPASLEDPVYCAEVIYGLALTWLELTRARSVGRLIQFSTSEVFGTSQTDLMNEGHPIQPHTPYAAAKAAADHLLNSYVRTFGVNAWTIRPFNCFGPRQNSGRFAGLIPILLSKIDRAEPIEVFGDGLQTRDFTYVTDCARFTASVGSRAVEGGVDMNVGSGAERSVLDVISAVLRACGRDITEYPMVYSPPRPGDVRRHCADSSFASTGFGWKPETEFEAAIANTVSWHRDLSNESPNV
jgi:UDP-glucose 4-epimerase